MNGGSSGLWAGKVSEIKRARLVFLDGICRGSFYRAWRRCLPGMKCSLSSFQCSRYNKSPGTSDGRLLIDAPWLYASHTDRQLRNLSNQLCTRLTQTCTDTLYLGRVPVTAASLLAAHLTLTNTTWNADVPMFVFKISVFVLVNQRQISDISFQISWLPFEDICDNEKCLQSHDQMSFNIEAGDGKVSLDVWKSQ